MADDIFAALRADHDTARTYMKILDGTNGGSDGRREVYPKLVKELLAHAKAEERTLYHALIGDRTTQDEASHSVAEHEDIESHILSVSDTSMSSPQWLQKFRKLKSLVEHHMDEEEEETFKAGRGVLSESKQSSLGAAYRKAREVEDEESRSEFMPD